MSLTDSLFRDGLRIATRLIIFYPKRKRQESKLFYMAIWIVYHLALITYPLTFFHVLKQIVYVLLAIKLDGMSTT